MSDLNAALLRWAEIAVNPVVITELARPVYEGLTLVVTVESTLFSEIAPLIEAYGGATVVTLPDDVALERFHIGTIERAAESEVAGQPVVDIDSGDDFTMGSLIRNERVQRLQPKQRLATHSRELVLA